MFTKPNINQRFIDRERNEALLAGRPDPYPMARPNLNQKASVQLKSSGQNNNSNVAPKNRTYNFERFWDQDFNAWFNAGMPDDDTMPGDHPVPGHEWNINREAMLKRIGHRNNDVEEY